MINLDVSTFQIYIFDKFTTRQLYVQCSVHIPHFAIDLNLLKNKVD
jgi:hypothetical protein